MGPFLKIVCEGDFPIIWARCSTDAGESRSMETTHYRDQTHFLESVENLCSSCNSYKLCRTWLSLRTGRFSLNFHLNLLSLSLSPCFLSIFLHLVNIIWIKRATVAITPAQYKGVNVQLHILENMKYFAPKIARSWRWRWWHEETACNLILEKPRGKPDVSYTWQVFDYHDVIKVESVWKNWNSLGWSWIGDQCLIPIRTNTKFSFLITTYNLYCLWKL